MDYFQKHKIVNSRNNYYLTKINALLNQYNFRVSFISSNAMTKEEDGKMKISDSVYRIFFLYTEAKKKEFEITMKQQNDKMSFHIYQYDDDGCSYVSKEIDFKKLKFYLGILYEYETLEEDLEEDKEDEEEEDE
jgi:hypothetical protein